MAVVQISRIQVRRGQKQQGSGLPQLASGELGWAIDTRELFIGNGSVAEGAPAVGNTKVLTEYDDLFQLADTYTYRESESYLLTGANSTNPIKRTLQQRLDDRVSVRSFGAKGDGITNDTESLQRAIDQLYINDATKTNPSSRVVLHLEAGVYLISDTIKLPPFATLIGAGPGKTIIKQSTSAPAFETVNSSSTPGNHASDASSTTLNQAREIVLEGLTIEMTSASDALVLQSCKDSYFRMMDIEGPWTNSTAIATDSAVRINALSGAVGSSNNTFANVKITGFSYAVYSDWDTKYNHFDSCKFATCGLGIVFGENTIIGAPGTGQSTGPCFNEIKSSEFEEISKHAIWVANGEHNVSHHNNFTFVGNDGGIEKDPKFAVIKYDVATNKSIDDYFSRTNELISGSGLLTVPYVPEIDGTAFYELKYENAITFGRLNDTRLFRLPGVINQAYDIEYIMVSNNYRLIRKGVMTVIVDAYANPGDVEISDDYHFIGDESYVDSIRFDAIVRDVDSTLPYDTIDVKVTSTMPIDDQTELKFIIKAKKTDII